VIRTSILREIGGFDEQYQVAADYAVALRISQLARPVELQETIALFAPAGLSQTKCLLSVREFHCARLSILKPRGWQRFIEGVHTLWNSGNIVGHNVQTSIAQVLGLQR